LSRSIPAFRFPSPHFAFRLTFDVSVTGLPEESDGRKSARRGRH
jgi:hypothetical protein